MGSISGRFSGIGSAINNSISRVGQPLLGALIFIPISAAVLRVARLRRPASTRPTRPSDARSSRSTRRARPRRPTQVAASNLASIDAFHLAMLVCAGLLVIGAAVSWYGLPGARRCGRNGRHVSAGGCRGRAETPVAARADAPTTAQATATTADKARVDRTAPADGLTAP